MFSINTLAQRGYDDYLDIEDIKDFERYAHLGLSKAEIISIVIGLILLLMAKNMNISNKTIEISLICIGLLCSIPLVLVILAIAQKIIGYAIILGLILGGLYLLFGYNKQ
jgi:hypothetical protein